MTGLREMRKKKIAPVYRGCRVRVEVGIGTITQADGIWNGQVPLCDAAAWIALGGPIETMREPT